MNFFYLVVLATAAASETPKSAVAKNKPRDKSGRFFAPARPEEDYSFWLAEYERLIRAIPRPLSRLRAFVDSRMPNTASGIAAYREGIVGSVEDEDEIGGRYLNAFMTNIGTAVNQKKLTEPMISDIVEWLDIAFIKPERIRKALRQLGSIAKSGDSTERMRRINKSKFVTILRRAQSFQAASLVSALSVEARSD